MSLDDCLIGIQKELNTANQAVNDKRWPLTLSALDRIIELAQEAFERVGDMPGAPPTT